MPDQTRTAADITDPAEQVRQLTAEVARLRSELDRLDEARREALAVGARMISHASAERASRQAWAAEAGDLHALVVDLLDGDTEGIDPLHGVEPDRSLPEISLDQLLAAKAERLHSTSWQADQ